ncbi:MAG: ABC transporter substrate-binding protein [Bryobacteraceae bacterium]|nr:ABC transporter substrate-binding protein [Bryobacteraceae bacterium]
MLAAATVGTLSVTTGVQTSFAQAAKPPFVVGFTDVLSGPNAGLGTPLLAGAKAYFDSVNARGGVHGRKIDLRVIDSQADATRVATSIQDLQGAGAVAIMGLTISGNVEAAAPIANRAKVSLFSGGTSAKLLNPFQPYLFSSDITTASEGQMQIDFVRKHLFPNKNDLKVALYYNQTAGVIAYVEILKDLMKQQQPGWRVVADEVVPLNVTDAGVAVAKMLSAQPDVVIMGAVDPVAILAVRAMVAQGSKIPAVNFHGGNAERTMLVNNYPGYYAIRQYPTTQDSNAGRGYAEMIAAMKSVGIYDGLITSYNAITGYNTALQITAILNKCGENCNSESLQKTTHGIGQIDTGGITFKPVVYSPTRHQGVDTGRFYRANNGKLEAVGDMYSAAWGKP